MHASTIIPSEIDLVDKQIFQPCSFALTAARAESESQEYLAYRFKLDNKQITFRKAKITPTKVGQFVTLWKRDSAGITCPYHIDQDIDYVLILTQTAMFAGIFIFPKEVLHQKGIFSDDKKEGKRGFRVYPAWDKVCNKQAQKTQTWQLNYFIAWRQDGIDIQTAKKLLSTE